MSDLTAVVLVCTLKPSPAESSSTLIGEHLMAALQGHGVVGDLIRVVDEGVRFGVSTDEGDGDGWPRIRERILAADIVAIATPIWMGQPSSVSKMVLERLDAELSETGAEGRLSMSGKAAVVAVVGNEDGAHHVIAECLQALNDVGFTIPASAGAYWVGEAMQAVDYQDLDETPEKTQQTIITAASNAVHLASLLRANPYPVP